MTDKWIINSAKTVGRSHIRENIPCQDSVASLQKNSVSVIALSDGCGSSPLSHYGSDITVKALCDLFANNFDLLYNGDDNAVRKAVVSTIVEQLKSFIKTNTEMISEFNSVILYGNAIHNGVHTKRIRHRGDEGASDSESALAHM